MQTLTVAAKEVKKGDQVWNSLASRPEYRWSGVVGVFEVEGVFTLEGGQQIKRPAIEIIAGFSMVCHPEEAVVIRRF